MITIKRRNCVIAMATVLLLGGTSANGQNQKSIDSLTSVTTWIDKETGKELNAIVEYQEIKAKHDASVAQLDSLKRESVRCDSTKSAFIRRQNEYQRGFASIYSSRTKPKAERLYLQCDTTILLRHEGLYGDSLIECMQKALLAYHRAESVLSVRYNKGSVEKVRETLETAKEYLPDECAELDRRLEQYGTLTESLRNALAEADTLDRLNPTEELSSSSTERYTRRFFDKLAEHLNPTLLVSGEYPYLYDILAKAMSAIMDDPRKDIAELVEEL